MKGIRREQCLAVRFIKSTLYITTSLFVGALIFIFFSYFGFEKFGSVLAATTSFLLCIYVYNKIYWDDYARY